MAEVEPSARQRENAELVREGFNAFNAGDLEAEGIHPVGDQHVVVEVHQTGRGAGSGIEIEQDVAFVFEVAEGKATRVQLYADLDAAVAAAKGLGGQPDA